MNVARISPAMKTPVKIFESNLRCMKNITTIANLAAERASSTGTSTADIVGM
ncbi:hypothetical protein D3C83_285080 [compost metagenome]